MVFVARVLSHRGDLEQVHQHTKRRILVSLQKMCIIDDQDDHPCRQGWAELHALFFLQAQSCVQLAEQALLLALAKWLTCKTHCTVKLLAYTLLRRHAAYMH